MLTFLGWVLGAVVVKRFPENFEWQVKSAMKKGNLESAERIARSRVDDEHYDFGAHRLLAQVLLKSGKVDEAVSTLLMSLDRMGAASGRDVYTRGADPAATYELLTDALVQQGRISFAQETSRIAKDYRASSSTNADQSPEELQPVVETAAVDDTTDTTSIDLKEFESSPGVELNSGGTMRFSNSSTATISLEPSATGISSELIFKVSGSKALGLGSILKITIGDENAFLIYADSEVPRAVVVPFEKRDVNSSLPLTLEFINDAFDPVTKSDRNLEVHQLAIR